MRCGWDGRGGNVVFSHHNFLGESREGEGEGEGAGELREGELQDGANLLGGRKPQAHDQTGCAISRLRFLDGCATDHCSHALCSVPAPGAQVTPAFQDGLARRRLLVAKFSPFCRVHGRCASAAGPSSRALWLATSRKTPGAVQKRVYSLAGDASQGSWA